MNNLNQNFDISLDLLCQLEALLKAEGESNWIRGVRAAIIAGKSRKDGSVTEEDAFQEMASTYRSLYGGAGSFSDYFIWREDLEERQEANKKFDKITNQLWSLLG